ANHSDEYYYQIRDLDKDKKKFNKLVDYKRAARTIYLNKACFNGLYRVNKEGKFNVPPGVYKNPLICDEINLQICSKLLKNVEITFGNYENILNIGEGSKTFVYFDPPYRPIKENKSFTSYDKSGFNDDDQIKLSKNFKKLDKKKCFIMLSNSDPKNINKNDNFFDDLYKNFQITRIFAKRMINCKSSGRGNITEIIVTNYKV
ncbi:MAG: Dam family site-specific DNA-(adenine-N6)-methyltransferase, partial [Malacoplasma sp.]|nr:Dam family site-specific DNA-(adenine-N6)-methyltransferase [Malacoplasma sp.]